MDANDKEIVLLGGLAVVGFVTWKWGNPVTAANIAITWAQSLVGRGNKLDEQTVVGGIVQEIPEVLADMATGVLGFAPDRDTLALARMGRSEGTDGMEYRMHVALNDLASLQGTYGTGVYSSVEALMIHSKVAAADGHFSEQQYGKRYATTDTPYEADYALAQKVIADNAAGVDPTQGATKFVDKSSFRAQPGATQTYEQVLATWTAQGYTAQNLPNATNNFVVFVPA